MSENETPIKKSENHINKPVFFTSALLIFLLVAFAAAFPDLADKNFKLLQNQIFTNASWFYILAVALILLVRNAVFRRDGDRPNVLRGGRTGDALPLSAGWYPGNGRSRQAGHAPDLLPLGTPCMGDLRDSGVDTGLL